jgi:hypothetical protein
MVKDAKPQSKQTKSFGNIKTVGLSSFFNPGKWMLISAPNSVRFFDPHVLHAISSIVLIQAH